MDQLPSVAQALALQLLEQLLCLLMMGMAGGLTDFSEQFDRFAGQADADIGQGEVPLGIIVVAIVGHVDDVFEFVDGFPIEIAMPIDVSAEKSRVVVPATAHGYVFKAFEGFFIEAFVVFGSEQFPRRAGKGHVGGSILRMRHFIIPFSQSLVLT